jgi:hypothetical protein
VRLVFLLLADSAEISEHGKMNIEGAGIHAVVAPSFPIVMGRMVDLAPIAFPGRGDYAVHVLVDGFDLGAESLYVR